MKVCLAQLEVGSSKGVNLRKIMSAIEDLGPDTKLVVFPEYSMGYPNDGLTASYLEKTAEDLGGKFVGEVAKLSRKKRVGVVLPIYEREGDRIYNTAAVIVKGKVLGGYRKSKLFDALGHRESDLFERGSGLAMFELEKVRFGMVICYDIRFPELTKRQALAGAKVILVPSAWYKGEMKEEQWHNLLAARAQEDTCYVVGVGNANPAFIGRSVVVTPFGVKAMDLGTGEHISVFELDLKMVREARRKLPLLSQSDKVQPWCYLLG